MKMPQLVKLWAWSLGFLLFYAVPACAQSATHPAALNPTAVRSPQQILQELAKADVVYLGETHNRLADHQAQLEIIQALAKRGKVAIAMEMFQHPYQGAIDAYLQGKITETELLERTQYEQRWGFPWENYAPILRFARERQLPVLAINTPTEITRKVARQGIESLTPEERELIPPLAEIRTDNLEYRQYLQAIFQQHQTAGQGNSESFERFFLAQVLWDETMADKIAAFVHARPQYQVIVLAGQGHLIYGYGIPSRVARRIDRHSFLQYSVLLNPGQNLLGDRAIADFFWSTP